MWKPLRERLDKLPLILAGPILRRTETNSVTVWIALRNPYDVTLKIYDQDWQSDNQDPPDRVYLQGTATPRQIGDHLLIVAVTANVGRNLVPDQTYFYNIWFDDPTDPTAPSLNLNSADVVASENGPHELINYPNHNLPSFSIPSNDLNKLHILHASCRKPHGGGIDMFPAIDTIIEQNYEFPANRPHALFLTGDQIYADDVADVMLSMLIDASVVLLGWEDALPIQGSADHQLRPGNRGQFVKEEAGFTSGFTTHASFDESVPKSHLIRFGEFCTMYLFCWSNVLWPEMLPEDNQINSDPKFVEEFQRRLDKERKLIIYFQAGLRYVRRGMANVPTYMAFDDHEITDDWLLTGAWCKEVLNRPLGRRIIENGLSAYALFQAWGNTPAQFSDQSPGPGPLLFNALESLYHFRSSLVPDARQKIAKALGFPSNDSELEAHLDFLVDQGQLKNDDAIRWSYSFSLSNTQVVVLDTRTRRGYQDAMHGPAALLHNKGIEEQITEIPWRNPELVLLVSPGPYVGETFVEWIQEKASSLSAVPIIRSKQKLVAGYDAESWHLHQWTFEMILSSLGQWFHQGGQPKGRVVILSGDVHYGFASRLHYWATRPLGTNQSIGTELILAQLTSSPLKNQEGKTEKLHQFGYPPDLFGTVPPSFETVGWNEMSFLETVGTVTFRITDPIELKDFLLNSELGPKVVSTEDFEEYATRFELNKAPDWYYQITYLRTEREVRLENGTLVAVEENVDPQSERIDRLIDYLLGTGFLKHVKEYVQSRGPGREIGGLNNLGQVSIVWRPDKKEVVQDLWWRGPDTRESSLAPFPLSRFRVDLNHKTVEFPTELRTAY
ncbi:MAG: hypothetical protein CL609_10795 [Anaerolineaceae bacterium]|nr:hypothetical protein [Anaerolineaceae bacterium]